MIFRRRPRRGSPVVRRDGATVRRARAEKRRRAARRTLFAALGLVAAAAAGLVLRDYRGWIDGAQMFRVRDLEVRGFSRVNPDEIPALVTLKQGESIFAFDTASLSADITRHPWVRRAAVTKVLPDRVDVEIEEREPVALVQVDRKLIEVDAEGALLPTRGGNVADDLPMITGVEVPLVIPYGQSDAAAPWSRAAAFLVGIERALPISELHVNMKANEFEVMEEDGTRLLFPADAPGARLAELARVLGELSASDLVADFVDMRFRDQIVVGGARFRTAEPDSSAGREGENAG